MDSQVLDKKIENNKSPEFPQKNKRGKARKIIIISICAFILIFSIVSMIVTKTIYDGNFGRAEIPTYSVYLRYDDITGYDRSSVSFMSGENKLAGYIYGEENNKGVVVIAHGLGGGAESYLAETMFFVDNGWRVFVYDCTGSYNSEGKSTRGLPQSALDLDSALVYIDSLNWGLPVMLYGHSWGGFAVTAVLNFNHDIHASVSISGYATGMNLLHEQSKSMMGGFANIVYPFLWTYQRIIFGADAGLSAVDGINKSNIPVMIVHGTKDDVILYDGAGIIAHREQITNPNVVYITRDEENQDGHNNLFTAKEAGAYIDEINEEWREIYYSHDEDIPENIKIDFYSGIDKQLTSALDLEFMNEVNAFFEQHLEK